MTRAASAYRRTIVKLNLLTAASALALACLPAGAFAQQMNMPGMTMPMPAKPAAKKKATARPAPHAHHGTIPTKAEPAASQQMPGMEMPAQAAPSEVHTSPPQMGQM